MSRVLQLTAVFLLIALCGPAPAEWDETERAIIDWADANVEASIALLEETVNINSGTMNAAGVRQVGAVLAREYAAIGFTTEWLDAPQSMQRAGHLVARSPGGKGNEMEQMVYVVQ